MEVLSTINTNCVILVLVLCQFDANVDLAFELQADVMSL